MEPVLEALGRPHARTSFVHVAGTNGKGSTCAMIEAALRTAGQHTGLFTSPHLSAVEERIQVERQSISPTELAALLTEIRDRLPASVTPTFFEVGTAAGFSW